MTVRKWGSEEAVNSTIVGVQRHPDVAALGGGGYVIVWEDDNPATPVVRGQRYDVAGNTLGGEFTVPTNGFGGQNPAVTGLADGGFVVGLDVVFSPTDRDPCFQRYDTDGHLVGVLTDIDQTADDMPSQISITRLNSGFVEAYHTGAGDLAIVTRDANGTPIRSFSLGPNYTFPDVVALTDTTFAFAYDAGSPAVNLSIWNGSSFTTTQVNTTSVVGSSVMPKVTVLSNGGIVVAFETTHSSFPGSNYDIRARLFDSDGQPLGNDFLVNTITIGGQDLPDIVATSDGGFVVVYEDANTLRVLGQAFDAFGGRLGREFIVSTSPIHDFIFDSMSAATLADGRIVVTWQGGDDGSGAGIFSQIIDPRDGLVYGTPTPEILYGHPAISDEINGLGGADTIYGLGGNDVLYGGDGNDLLVGAKGDDDLFGGNGNDILKGGSREDALDGGTGFDVADYRDRTLGVVVTLNGATEAEVSMGGIAEDTVRRVEAIYGSSGADSITGDNAWNTFTGGAGNDSLSGMAGNDYLRGDGGADRLTGGAGADRFVFLFKTDSGIGASLHDTVVDFSHAEMDKIDLAGIDAVESTPTNDAFTSLVIGSGAFTGSHQLRFDPATHLLSGNVNANLAADFEIYLPSVSSLGLGDILV